MECRGSVGEVFRQHSTQRKAFVHRGSGRFGWSGDVFRDFCPFSLINTAVYAAGSGCPVTGSACPVIVLAGKTRQAE